MQIVAYTAGPGVPKAIAHTTMNYRIDLIGQTSYVRTKHILQRFRDIFLVLLAAKFKTTKTYRGSLLAAYGSCLAHPTSSVTPPGVHLISAGRGCLRVAAAAR